MLFLEADVGGNHGSLQNIIGITGWQKAFKLWDSSTEEFLDQILQTFCQNLVINTSEKQSIWRVEPRKNSIFFKKTTDLKLIDLKDYPLNLGRFSIPFSGLFLRMSYNTFFNNGLNYCSILFRGHTPYFQLQQPLQMRE